MSYPGVPKLLNNPAKAAKLSVIGAGINKLWDILFPGPQWGVFKVGTSEKALTVTSVASIDYGGDSRTSDYQVETGSFVTYNKVGNPNVANIVMTRDGNEKERAEFMKWLEENTKKTTVFDVLVPEYRYSKMTLVSYRISRSAANGATLVAAECVFQQVRELPGQYKKTQPSNPNLYQTDPTRRGNATVPPVEPQSKGGAVSWQ